MNQDTPFGRKLLRKLKLPLKIIFFLLYLARRVILTKDNLVKRYFSSNPKCCYYNSNETIQHLPFNYHHVKNIWRVVQMAMRLNPPASVAHIAGKWLSHVNFRKCNIILVIAAAMCWAIWWCRNHIYFHNVKYTSFFQADNGFWHCSSLRRFRPHMRGMHSLGADSPWRLMHLMGENLIIDFSPHDFWCGLLLLFYFPGLHVGEIIVIMIMKIKIGLRVVVESGNLISLIKKKSTGWIHVSKEKNEVVTL